MSRPGRLAGWVLASLWLGGVAIVPACGGTVVFEEDGGQGDGDGDGDGATSGPSTSAGTPTTKCRNGSECAEGEVCVWSTGDCRKSCNASACDSCGPGFVCESCATSGCRDCEDCVSACLPADDDRCDDDDPCPEGSWCQFSTGQCLEDCDALAIDLCASGICSACASSSCCGCRDCIDLCVQP